MEKSNPCEPIADLGDDPIVLGLKRLYDSVIEEPVPDDFMSLLRQIDETLKNDDGNASRDGPTS